MSQDTAIQLSDKAVQQVKKLMTEANEASKALRVFVEAGGCSGFSYGMAFDEAQDGDTAFEVQGLKVIVDPASFVYLKGAVIEFNDGLDGHGFEIKNPNAKGSCGCGKSFQ